MEFPSVRARRLPLPKTQRDNLAEISAPAVIEGNIQTTMIAAMRLAIETYGIDWTIDCTARCLRMAREVKS